MAKPSDTGLYGLLEECRRVMAVTAAKVRARFPAGTLVVVPLRHGGGAGSVERHLDDTGHTVVVYQGRGADEPRTHFVPAADLLACNPL
jgi:hypothetical protein